MKIKLKSLALLLIVACTCMVTFSSCGKEETTPQTTSKIVMYYFSCSDDVLEVADVTVTYIDLTGRSHTEKITKKQWYTLYPSVAIGTKLSMTISATKRTDVTFSDDETFDFQYTYLSAYGSNTSNPDNINDVKLGSSTITWSEVDAALDEMNGTSTATVE